MLRGIAALLVCIFHFSNGNKGFLSDDSLFRIAGSVGWSGVEMFFIISGFVIPYSLYNGNYKYKGYINFLIKRVIRIHPPFIISILLILVLNYLSTLSPYFKGSPFSLDIENIFFHFFYLNDFLKEPWLNPVYWTLAIEFQYYIVIGLLFPLVVHQNVYLSLSTLLLFASTKLMFPEPYALFHFSPFFSLGILIFLSETNEFTKKLSWVLHPLILAFVYHQFGDIAFYVSLFTVLLLQFGKNWENKTILFLGTISYSLYLIHVPIGGRIINLSKNFVDGDGLRTLIVLLALVVTIICSYLFYRIVEHPFIKLTSFFSKKIKTQNG